MPDRQKTFEALERQLYLPTATVYFQNFLRGVVGLRQRRKDKDVASKLQGERLDLLALSPAFIHGFLASASGMERAFSNSAQSRFVTLALPFKANLPLGAPISFQAPEILQHRKLLLFALVEQGISKADPHDDVGLGFYQIGYSSAVGIAAVGQDHIARLHGESDKRFAALLTHSPQSGRRPNLAI